MLRLRIGAEKSKETFRKIAQLTSEEGLEQAQGVCQRSAEWNG